VEERDVFPSVEELVKYFTGELKIVKGSIPSKAFYIGPDPEKHLLFSHVNEEVYAQTGETDNHIKILSCFGLGEDFIYRRISTLSGGEKMKLALDIAFSKTVECIVLHGVLPWLDREGKDRLFNQIQKKISNGMIIVLLEQEIEEILDIADNTFYFDGENVLPFNSEKRERRILEVNDLSNKISTQLKKSGKTSVVVEFDTVGFQYKDENGSNFQLDSITFKLESSRIFGLVGENGSGKSTIAKLILRILKNEQGKIYFNQRDILDISRTSLVEGISFVGQFPEQHITFSNVEQYKKWAQKLKNTLSNKMLEIIFPNEKDYPVSILSPLQLKLLLLISSISTNTKLIILDEPTWGLDLEGEKILLEILLSILDHLHDCTILVISHDKSFLERLNTKMFRMDNGRLLPLDV
jgi:ABC-type multidrug transport system ATPase subunit